MPQHLGRIDRDHIEVLFGMEDFVTENLKFLGDVAKNWQPADYLPNLEAEDWPEQVAKFREQSLSISDELLVILVGDMITEEALPAYSMALNAIAEDQTGDDPRPWSVWLRSWTAEENRHGDLLNAYLRLTGRVDMRSVELTVHNLLANGFDPKSYPDPYGGLIYTSFQERATKISHGNVGKIVAIQGDSNLGKICQRIAGDESRHEAFYSKMMRRVFELDPAGAMMSFREMLRSLISMPGRLMYDGKDPDLFDHFAIVAQRLNVYTVRDYASIIDHLVKLWDIPGRAVTGKAAKAQEWLCRQSERYAAFADEITASLESKPLASFAWIYDRKA